MTTDTETPAPPQKRLMPPVWVAALAGIVTLNLIERFTDWSWWFYRAPLAIIAVAAVAYYWVKSRRRPADTPADAVAG